MRPSFVHELGSQTRQSSLLSSPVFASYKLGFVKLLRRRRSSGKGVPFPGPTCSLGGPLYACHLGPPRASLPHLFAVLRRRQQMPSRAKVLGNGAIRGQEALGMSRGLEPLHAIFSLACGPMRVFTAVIEIPSRGATCPRLGASMFQPIRVVLPKFQTPIMRRVDSSPEELRA